MVLFTKEKGMGHNITEPSCNRSLPLRRSTLPAFLRRRTQKPEIIYEERPDFYFKLVLLGDAGSGKSTLAQVFSCSACRAVFQKRPSDTDTKTVEYVDRIITASHKNVLARLYDTAGKFSVSIGLVIVRFNICFFLNSWYNGHWSKQWNSSSKQFDQVLHFLSLTCTATGSCQHVSTSSLWAWQCNTNFSILIKFKYGITPSTGWIIYISIPIMYKHIKTLCFTRLIKTFTFPTPWFTQASYKPYCKSV